VFLTNPCLALDKSSTASSANLYCPNPPVGLESSGLFNFENEIKKQEVKVKVKQTKETKSSLTFGE